MAGHWDGTYLNDYPQLNELTKSGRCLLEQRLFEHDDAAQRLAQAGAGSEEQVAVGAAVLLGVLDGNGRESFPDRPGRLVRGKNALARRNDSPGRRLQIRITGQLPPEIVTAVTAKM